MVTVSEIARKLQTYGQDEALEDLLKRLEFVSKAKEIFDSLPADSRSALRKLFTSRGAKRQRSRADKALAAVRKVTGIALPKEVSAEYKKCSAGNFWLLEEAQQSLELNSNLPIGTFLSNIYLRFTSLNAKRTWDTITWRFLLQFFADLATLLAKQRVTETVEDTLVSILVSSRLVVDTHNIIRENLKIWRSKGMRYAELSNSLDNGVPFLLPQSVTDNTWEELPVKTPIFQSVVEHLHKIGFCKESTRLRANALGTEIRETLIKPFRWHLSSLPWSSGHVMQAQLATSPTDREGSAVLHDQVSAAQPTSRKRKRNCSSKQSAPQRNCFEHDFPSVPEESAVGRTESRLDLIPAGSSYREISNEQDRRSEQMQTVQGQQGNARETILLATLAAAAAQSSQAVDTPQQTENSQTAFPQWIEPYAQTFSHLGQASETRMHSDQAQSASNELSNPAAQIRNGFAQGYNNTSTAYLNTNSGVPDSVDVADASYDSLMWGYEGSIGRNGATVLMPAAMSNSDQTSFSALEWAYGLTNRSDAANYSAANWGLTNQQG